MEAAAAAARRRFTARPYAQSWRAASHILVQIEALPDFPIFPLRLVALPSELVPLHIFEERFKEMIARCERTEPASEFGIVCVGEDDRMKEVGCACTIEDILERFDDGRVNLVARGTRPFRVDSELLEHAYPAAAVSFLEDEPGEVETDLLAEVHEAYAELVREATDKDPDLAEIAGMTAYEIAGTVEFGVEAKQQLLETRSEAARSEQLLRLLRGALKRLEFMERAQARARSNGKVRLGPPSQRSIPQTFSITSAEKPTSSSKIFGRSVDVSENATRPFESRTT